MKHSQQGVAILFAILLVSIVLTVGLSLVNITVRQLTLSSLARESQFAFYAADSARACARYYDSLLDPEDRPFGHFNIDAGNLVLVPPTDPNIVCAGNSIGLSGVNFATGEGDGVSYSFTLVLPVETERTSCAEVTVYKYTGPPTLNGKTRIVARGYNNYDSGNGSGCYRVSDRTVERASTMIY